MPDQKFTDREALLYHTQGGRPGKIEIVPTKPMATQRDLSLAYSPGVAAPVRAIAEDPDAAYDYTARGNLVAVISDGTAILGLGDLGALASKPVMEGKAVLFKRFADVDAIDLELDTNSIDEFCNAVRVMEPSFGGINLEDIKAPECFIIEQRLRDEMNIPVFHDDQHGTAIITAAGLINAMHLTGRDIKDCKIVVNGAGASAIACLELVKALGISSANAIICDSKGVIYQGREEGMNQWKAAHAADTDARTLAEAMVGADVALGLSVAGAFTPEMIESMADSPIIFAMANPDPEISPEAVHAVRSDAIVATGRSDYPNQVNNVLGFPYIFRGALDVRATTINEDMKIAAARSLAALAREDVPDEVASAYAGERPTYGRDYIIPAPFDPRLISHIPPAIAQAAMDSGVARRPIIDMDAYKDELSARLNPAAGSLQLIFNSVKANPKRVVFAEGEEEKVIRAALSFRNAGYGTPVLIAREEEVFKVLRNMGLDEKTVDLEIHNARTSDYNEVYSDYVYERQQRNGLLYRDCTRMVNNGRNVFGACMVAHGHADAMVTGITRNYFDAFDDIRRVIDPQPQKTVFGMSMVVTRERTVFIADTQVNELPNPSQLADIAMGAAAAVRRLGQEPRVAMLSYSNFGHPPGERSARIREAVEILDSRETDFEYDGEMAADVALNPELQSIYPFSRLSGPANILVMPALHSANISAKLLQELGGGSVVGPLLIGLDKSVQIVPIGSTASEVVNMAALAAYESDIL
ncbi:MAG: NADP-dependent malic enzyme [Alphaproteobacteria bacterium]|nr:MAG: NADP-dependent malic enzyme [Alphaproteobacteria bacterium]